MVLIVELDENYKNVFVKLDDICGKGHTDETYDNYRNVPICETDIYKCSYLEHLIESI